MKIYPVIAYRWGDRQQGASYFVGVFSSPGLANAAADNEEADRGMKYQCEISELDLDSPVPNAGFASPIIIREID